MPEYIAQYEVRDKRVDHVWYTQHRRKKGRGADISRIEYEHSEPYTEFHKYQADNEEDALRIAEERSNKQKNKIIEAVAVFELKQIHQNT